MEGPHSSYSCFERLLNVAAGHVGVEHDGDVVEVGRQVEGGDDAPEHGGDGQGQLLVEEEDEGGGGEGTGRCFQTFLTGGRLLRDGVGDEGAGCKGEGEDEEDNPSNHSWIS